MDTSAVDFPALALALLASAVITATIAWGARDGSLRRVWLTAAAVTAVLLAAGLVDLLREDPRETHLATLFIGIPLPVLGAVGMQRAARRLRPWVRWTLVYVVTVLLLFAGLLVGAAIAPRFL